MRRLRYNVATSLDGFMAGPHGEFDWILTDPSIDFAAFYRQAHRQFDTPLMGRHTYNRMPPARHRQPLQLKESKALPSGILKLSYAVSPMS